MTPAPPPPAPNEEELIDVGRVESWDATIEQDLAVGLLYALRWDTSDTNSAVSESNRYASFLFSGRRCTGTTHLRVVPRDHFGGTWEELAYRVGVGEVDNAAAGAAPPRTKWGAGLYTTSRPTTASTASRRPGVADCTSPPCPRAWCSLALTCEACPRPTDPNGEGPALCRAPGRFVVSEGLRCASSCSAISRVRDPRTRRGRRSHHQGTRTADAHR